MKAYQQNRSRKLRKRYWVKQMEPYLLSLNRLMIRQQIPKERTPKGKGGLYEHNHDPHLIRLKQVTERLNEERMLGEFKIDAIRAKVDQLGKIKMEFSEASNLTNSNKN